MKGIVVQRKEAKSLVECRCVGVDCKHVDGVHANVLRSSRRRQEGVEQQIAAQTAALHGLIYRQPPKMNSGDVMLRQAFGPLIWNCVKTQRPAGECVISLDSRIVSCRQDVRASQVPTIILPGAVPDEVVELGLPPRRTTGGRGVTPAA